MKIVEPSKFDYGEPLDAMGAPYQEFRDDEGIPVHIQFYVEDINDLETGHWERTGQRGAFINNYGMEGISDIQLHELEPDGETTTQRHVYDELVYVLEGNGFTTVGEGDAATTFEWAEGGFFYLPINAPYKHTNASGDETAKLMSHTQLPQMLQMTRNLDFIFECDFDFWEPEDDYYSAEAETELRTGRGHGHLGKFLWDTNYIPDLYKFEHLKTIDANIWGVSQTAKFPFFGSNLVAHMSEYPSGMYKKAHFHAPAYNILIMYGEGYELMWRRDIEQIIRLDYGPGSLITPPAGWWHHHFNLDPEVTGLLALHAPEIGSLPMREHSMFNPQGTVNTQEYVDEDLVIRETYKQELEARGQEFLMPDDCYNDPAFNLEDFLEENNPFVTPAD